MRRSRPWALRRGVAGAVAVWWLVVARVLLAAPPPAGTRGPHVWYRSSPGCPDGEQFVQRLQRLGRTASLASVGDPVDFVVTLASAPGRSSGRLERQSERGTVAIRELSAASCVEVAEGLALSLELAAQPPSEPGIDGAAPELASSEAPAGSAGVAVGVQLGGQSEVGGVVPSGALFAELGLGGNASARLSLRAAHGSIERDVLVSLGLVRAEACLRAWGIATPGDLWLSLHPCIGADVGVVQGDSRAESAQRQRAPWASAVAHLRGVLSLGSGVELDAQAGASVPVTRYEFRTERGLELTRTRSAGAQAALGASISW